MQPNDWDGVDRRDPTHLEKIHDAIVTLQTEIAWLKNGGKWVLSTSGAILVVVIGVLMPVVSDIHGAYDKITGRVDKFELALNDVRRNQDAWKIRISQDHRSCHGWRMSP